MDGGLLLYVGLAGIFAAFVIVLNVFLSAAAERQQVGRSLGAVRTLPQSSELGRADVQAPLVDRVLAPALARLTRVGRRFSAQGMVDRISRRLDQAGNPRGWSVDRVLAYKALALIVLGWWGFLLGVGKGFSQLVLYVLAFAGFGFFLPDILVYNNGLRRQQIIQRTLPDAMDLLTISVEAGLGFDAALSQVARNTTGPLAGELFRVLQEMQIGKSRADAFRALGERTDVPELRSFITAMIQADVFGIPIANVLRGQAREMRIKRTQRAEEQAQKVPVKILFPLVFCILPALFVVVIGPGIISILRSFART